MSRISSQALLVLGAALWLVCLLIVLLVVYGLIATGNFGGFILIGLGYLFFRFIYDQ